MNLLAFLSCYILKNHWFRRNVKTIAPTPPPPPSMISAHTKRQREWDKRSHLQCTFSNPFVMHHRGTHYHGFFPLGSYLFIEFTDASTHEMQLNKILSLIDHFNDCTCILLFLFCAHIFPALFFAIKCSVDLHYRFFFRIFNHLFVIYEIMRKHSACSENRAQMSFRKSVVC